MSVEVSSSATLDDAVGAPSSLLEVGADREAALRTCALLRDDVQPRQLLAALVTPAGSQRRFKIVASCVGALAREWHSLHRYNDRFEAVEGSLCSVWCCARRR
jgi:hypothetical protein